jgi:hypothetical protein
MDRVAQRILVPVDVFSAASCAALAWALGCSDDDLTVLHVWDPHDRRGIFAESPEGVAFTDMISEAESSHDSLGGRIELGAEPSQVIVEMIEREGFDVVVMGDSEGDSPVAQLVSERAPCRVVTVSRHPKGGPAQATLTWNRRSGSRIAIGSGAPPAPRASESTA